MLTWIVGAGGLLGSALQRQIRELYNSGSIPWRESSAASTALSDHLEQFAAAVRESESQEWRIYWAAGASVVASSEAEVEREVRLFEDFVCNVRDRLPAPSGAFFLASSAGGVYAGSSSPPYGQDSIPQPISPYGMGKRQLEQCAAENLSSIGRLVIGRIANLYGPGQSMHKQQGLIYSMCRAAAHRQPLSIYVPLSTLRDYIFVDDAAAQIRCFVEKSPSGQHTVVIASGQATSISSLIAVTERVTHRRIPISSGDHHSARNQVLDLRLIPSSLPEGCTCPETDLATGIRRTFDAVIKQSALSPS